MLPRQAFPIPFPPILYYRTLFPIPLPGITSFALRFNPSHAYNMTSGRHGSDQPILCQEWALNKWATRSEPFWWSCIPRREAGHSSKTVRSWMARRVRSAVVESLGKRGLGRDGRAKEGERGLELVGSAQFIPETAVLKMGYKELVGETDVAVERMLSYKPMVKGPKPKAKAGRLKSNGFQSEENSEGRPKPKGRENQNRKVSGKNGKNGARGGNAASAKWGRSDEPWDGPD